MTGYRKFFWKIVSITAALAVLLPRIALGEFGVCPPYSKTFGPDDSPEEIATFLTEINLRPGGGTLILEPGTYGRWFPSGFFVSGVICIKSSHGTDDQPLVNQDFVNQDFQVQSGGMLTFNAIRLTSEIGVSIGGTLFADAASISTMEISGMAHVVDTSVSFIRNSGTLVMVRGGIQLWQHGFGGTYLRNEGVAFLERVVVRDAFDNDQFDTYEGGLINHDGGVLTLSGVSMAGNYGCYCGVYCGCGGEIFNGAGGVLNVFGSVLDDPCSGSPITDLGYNVFGPGSGCQATAPTSIEAEPLVNDDSLELRPGSPAIDRIPLERCSETDMLGRARNDGDGDGVVACDAGALEYGYAAVEAKVRARAYFWREVGEIDLSASDLITIYVFSTETFDATQIIFDTVAIEGFGFARDAGGWPYIIDVYRDGLKDYQATWRMSRMPPLSCGYQEHEFLAMTRDGRDVRGLLKFEAVGCAP